MAKLHNTEFITTDSKIWEGVNDTVKTVGHNRAIRYDKETLTCYLHGHAIVKISEKRALGSGRRLEVVLDTCGYKTVTTRQAMYDFMSAYGFRFGVSFAKGKFGIRYLNTSLCAITDKYGYSELEVEGDVIRFVANPIHTLKKGDAIN